MGLRCSMLIVFGAACMAGCGQEEADTPAEIAARGGGPVDAEQAPKSEELATVESVAPADAPAPVSKTLLRPVAESERVEVTRPDSTPSQAIPPMRTVPSDLKESQTPAADDAPKPEDEERVADGEENERERRRSRRRDRSRRDIVVSGPITPGPGGFNQGPSGSSADFGTGSVPASDFGEFSPDEYSDGSEYSGYSAAGDYGPEYADGGYPGGYDGGSSGGFGGGFPGEFDVAGDDLSQTTDGYNPPAGGGPPVGRDGRPSGRSDGGLAPTPPAPPPDF